MPVMDEFKEERAALKNASFKVKWNYFWDYYKLPVVVTAFVVILVTSFIVQIMQQKETAVFVAMVNGGELKADPEPYIAEFSEYAGINTETHAALFDTSMYIDFDNPNEVTTSSLEKMLVYIAAQEIDVMVAPTDMMEYYGYSSTFIDLRNFLTEEQIAKYEPYFYYIDQAVIREKEAAQEVLNYDYTPAYPEDPSDPTSMQEPIPIGIFLRDNTETFSSNYYIGDEDPAVGVILNTKRPEAASQFIEFIFQDMK